MISLSQDYNIEKIAKKAALLRLTTQHEYRIYGLKEGYKSTGLIEFPKSDQTLFPIACNVCALFWHNNVGLDWKDTKEGNVISIGLRRDLRENVEFAASLLQTIVFAFEEMLVIDNKQSKTILPGIPKFEIEKK